MALLICPDCNKNVSSRVEMCPFCGCPKEFFINNEANAEKDITNQISNVSTQNAKKEERREEKKEVKQQSAKPKKSTAVNAKQNEYESFTFLNHTFKYKKNARAYAQFKGNYYCVANRSYDLMCDAYVEAKNVENVICMVIPAGKELINTIIDEACKDLYSRGIMMTVSGFINKYSSSSLDIDEKILSIYDQYDDIVRKQGRLEQSRMIAQANRSRWQGGGFGLKGALKGAATAALLNAGSDVLHSIGDSARASSDNSVIAHDFNLMYREESNKRLIANAVYSTILYISNCVEKELIEHNVFPSIIPLDSAKAKQIYETAKAYEKSKDVLQEKMLEAIEYYPLRVNYYKEIGDSLVAGGNDDFEAFISFWNISYLLNSWIEKKKDYIWWKQEIENNSIDKVVKNNYSIDNIERVGMFGLKCATKKKKLENCPKVGVAGDLENYYTHVPEKMTNQIMEDPRIVFYIREQYVASYIEKMLILLESMRIHKFDGLDECRKSKRLVDSSESCLFGFGKNSTFYVSSKRLYLKGFSKDLSIPISDIENVYVEKVKEAFLVTATDGNGTILQDRSFSTSFSASVCYCNILRYVFYYFFHNLNICMDQKVFDSAITIVAEQMILEKKSSNDEILKIEEKPEVGEINTSSDEIPLIEVNQEVEKKCTKFCAFCGKEIKRETKFCNYCGKQVNY